MARNYREIPPERRQAIGRRIRERRERRALYQIELAARLGLSQVAMSAIETGKNTPTLGTFLQLCEVLDCTADWLLKGDEGLAAPVGGPYER